MNSSPFDSNIWKFKIRILKMSNKSNKQTKRPGRKAALNVETAESVDVKEAKTLLVGWKMGTRLISK